MRRFQIDIRRAKSVISWTLSCWLLSACIATKNEQRLELKEAELQNALRQTLYHFSQDDLEYSVFVYRPAVWPFELFSKKFLDGEFTEAFKNIDLLYEGSNSDAEVFANMLNAGIIPALVHVRNAKLEPRNFKFTGLELQLGMKNYVSLDEKKVPESFNSFNYKALAANVHNTVVVTACVVAVVAAVSAASRSGGSFNGSGLGDVYRADGIFNPLHLRTYSDHHLYALKDKEIKAGEEFWGLVFFQGFDPSYLNRALPHFKIKS